MEDVKSIRELERQLEDLSRRFQRVADPLSAPEDLRYHLFTPVDMRRLDALVEATLCADQFARIDHGDHWVLTLVKLAHDRKRVALSLIETASDSWIYCDVQAS